MKQPLVSILMPVYNGRPYLEGAIRSVLEQSYENLELIIGDNASTDGTAEVVRQFVDKRIRFFRNETNVGVFTNLNRCIAASSGVYLQIFCDDDVMYRDCLASQLAMFAKYPDVGMVYSAGRMIDEHGSLVAASSQDDTPEYIDFVLYLWIASHYTALPPSLSSVMISRKTIDAVGLFNEQTKVSGDVEYWNRVSEIFPLARNPSVLMDIRTHREMLTQHPSSRNNYLREEPHLVAWYRKHWSPSEFRHVERFRLGTRGIGYARSIANMVLRGQFSEAMEGAMLLRRVYPIWRLLLVGCLKALRLDKADAPTLSPPARGI